jgi:acyl-CoA thioester hydrolase
MIDKPQCSVVRELYLYWQSVTTRWQDNDIYDHINNSVYYAHMNSIINGYMLAHSALDPQQGKIFGLVVDSFAKHSFIQDQLIAVFVWRR